MAVMSGVRTTGARRPGRYRRPMAMAVATVAVIAAAVLPASASAAGSRATGFGRGSLVTTLPAACTGGIGTYQHVARTSDGGFVAAVTCMSTTFALDGDVDRHVLLYRYDRRGRLARKLPGRRSVRRLAEPWSSDPDATIRWVRFANGRLYVSVDTDRNEAMSTYAYRLSGARVRSFGRSGVMNTTGRVQVLADGSLVSMQENDAATCSIAQSTVVRRWNRRGRRMRSFGTRGATTVARTRLTAATLDGMRLVLAGGGPFEDTASSGCVGQTPQITVVRLNSRGRADRSFGRRGRLVQSLQSTGHDGYAQPEDITVAASGRILVGAELNGPEGPDGALVLAVSSDGDLLRSFGGRRRGWAVSAPCHHSSYRWMMTDSQGRSIVGIDGAMRTKSGHATTCHVDDGTSRTGDLVARFTRRGRVDSTWATNGIADVIELLLGAAGRDVTYGRPMIWDDTDIVTIIIDKTHASGTDATLVGHRLIRIRG